MLEFIWKIPEFFYHITNFSWAEWLFIAGKKYPPCNCQLIPSALGNVYLLKSFALSFLYEASKNPDILSFSAKNGLEFF